MSSKDERERWIGQGKCGACGSRPLSKDSNSHCDTCLVGARVYAKKVYVPKPRAKRESPRARRRREGLCAECDSARAVNKSGKIMSRCRPHLDRTATNEAIRLWRRT